MPAPDNGEMLALILRRLDQLHEKVTALSPSGAPQFLTITEAAKATGESPDTIRRRIYRRELRFIQDKPGAAIRIDVRDLEAWAERRSKAPFRT